MLTQAQLQVNLRQTVTGWYLRTIQQMSVMNADGVASKTDHSGAKLVSVSEYTFAADELAGCLRVKKELENTVWELEASLLFMMLSAPNTATRYVEVISMPDALPVLYESDSEELVPYSRHVRRRT